MIRKVNLKGTSLAQGEVPKVGSNLRMYNPKFTNSDYTAVYSKLPADTVYMVVASDLAAHAIKIAGPSVIAPLSRFSCSKGFDKHFVYVRELHDLSP